MSYNKFGSKQITFGLKLSRKRAKTTKSEVSNRFRMPGRSCGRPDHSSRCWGGRPICTVRLSTRELVFGTRGLSDARAVLWAPGWTIAGAGVWVLQTVRMNSGSDEFDARTRSRVPETCGNCVSLREIINFGKGIWVISHPLLQPPTHW